MEYQIVRKAKEGLSVLSFEASTPVDAVNRAAVEGIEFRAFNSNPAQRAELQGQPKFVGLAGPMWDGNAIRYEDQAAYQELGA